jgi:hypothetical protein
LIVFPVSLGGLFYVFEGVLLLHGGAFFNINLITKLYLEAPDFAGFSHQLLLRFFVDISLRIVSLVFTALRESLTYYV